MNTKPKSYLNQMLSQLPDGGVATSVWLKSLGISNDLQQSYKRNGWLKSIGKGAFVKYNDEPEIEGGIFALQYQLVLDVHIGGRTSFILKSTTFFAHLGAIVPDMFGSTKTKLPKWFADAFSEHGYNFYNTSFLPTYQGIEQYQENGWNFKISSPERAILEMLYLYPEVTTLKDTYETLELLVNLRPDLLQNLLENCTSIKVKRLFLYMAEKIGHSWFQFLDLSKISLGFGKRVITKGGKLDKKYNIVIEDLDNI